MANPIQTMKIAGLDINPADFDNKANANFTAWMDHQGLKGQQRQDALEVYNNTMRGIMSGEYSLNENGQIEGITSGGTRYYKGRNGKARTNGNHRYSDIAFSPEESVRTYLYGIATHMKPKATNTSTTPKKSWSKTTGLANFLGNEIFGEGNTPSAEQINAWADDTEGAYSGTGPRSTEKRKAFINDRINAYMQALQNGDYDISDEDRDAELARMQELLNPSTQNYRRNAIAPWLSNLLFTDPKYYASAQDKQQAEQQAASETRMKQGEAYVNGVEGATNPYEQGSKQFNDLEEAKLLRRDDAFNNSFLNKTWNFNPSDKVYNSDVNESLTDDVFVGFNPEDLQKNLSTAFTLDTNEHGEDEANWFLPRTAQLIAPEDKGIGWGDQSLASTVYGNWLAANGGGDQTRGYVLHFGKNSRTNKAWLGKAAMDWARHQVGLNPDKYKVGNGSYILPELVNWDTGKGYIFDFSTGHGQAREINIGEYIKNLDKSSPLFLDLLNRWRYKNGLEALKHYVPKGADGMVISQKEQDFLDSLNTSDQPYQSNRYDYTADYSNNTNASIAAAKQQAEQARFQHAQEIGSDALKREDANNRALVDGLTTTDYLRIGAAAADVTSALAAFAPGYGTAAAAALGIGSTGANLLADIQDPGVSVGQLLGGLAFNAGMDVISLIPGLNISGTAGKLAKTLGKTLPKIVAGCFAIGMAPDAIASIQKLSDPKAKFTAEDLRNISYGLSALAGGSRMAAGVRNKKKFKAPEGSKTDFGEITYKKPDGSDGTLRVSQKDVEAIAAAGKEKGQDGALSKFREILKANKVPEADANASSFLGNVSYVQESKWKNPFNLRTKEVEFKPETNDVSGETYRWLQGIKTENDALRAKWAGGNRFQRFVNDRFATNAEMAIGGARPFKSSTRVAGADGRAEIDKRITEFERNFADQEAAIAGTTVDPNALGNARQGIPSKYVQDLAKAKAEYEATVKDVNASKDELKNAKQALKKAEAEYNAAVADKKLKRASKAAQRKVDAALNAGFDEAGLTATMQANELTFNSYSEALTHKRTLVNEIQTLANDLRNSGYLTKTDKLKKNAPAEAKAKFKELQKLKGYQDTLNNVDSTNAYNSYVNANKQLSALTTNKTKAGAYQAAINAKQAARDQASTFETAARDKLKSQKDALMDPANPGKLKPEVQAKIAAYRNAYSPKINETDAKYLAEAEKTIGKIMGATPGIENAKKAQFSKFMKDLKTSLAGNDMDADAVALELLGNKDFMNKMKAAYNFKQGGILKAQGGIKTTSTADPISTTSVADPIDPYTAVIKVGTQVTQPVTGATTGEAKIATGNITGNTETAPVVKVTGSHIDIGDNNPKGNGNTNRPPLLNWSDTALSGLELSKFLGTLRANSLIANKAKTIKPAYKVPLRTEYKIFTSKPLLDQAQEAKTESNRLGAEAARNTTDQGAAFAYRLAALKAGEAFARPYILQADADTRNSIDKSIANSNANMTNYIDVANSNEATKVAKDNNDTMADMQLMHDNATKAEQFATAIQHGVATSASANYQLGLSNATTNDPEFKQAYDDYLKWDAIAKDATKSEEERANAALEVTKARTRAENRKHIIAAEYSRNNIRPIGVPFAIPQYRFTTASTAQGTYDPAYDWFAGISYDKKGGKLEEYGRNLRHYSKLYFNAQKLLMQESNKKQKMMSNGYAYFQKLMMEGR